MTAVPVLQLRSRVAGGASVFAGKLLSPSDLPVLLTGDADVYKPDGTPLLMLRRRAIPVELTEGAYPALHDLRKRKSTNRGAYAGAKRPRKVFADGTIGKNTETRDADGNLVAVASAIIGYFDRQGGRFPFCRETSFNAQEPEKWQTIMPMIAHVADLFKRTSPNRYASQLAACNRCRPEFVISGTPFTTLTVNNNTAPSGTHTDKGDFKDGFGVISMVRRGAYTGALLGFPEYGVAVDLQDGDVLFFNSHEWHGVTDMVPQSEDAERISVVYYMREKMLECAASTERLKELRDGQSLEIDE